MAETTAAEGTAPAPKSKRPLVMGLALAILGGAGGFFAVQADLLPIGESPGSAGGGQGGEVATMGDIAFVPIDPIVISLRDQRSHLRFRAQLEVGRSHKSEVEKLMPRVIDVLNSYLRALEAEDIADGRSLARLRAQMLRRVQIVTGAGRVNDLLIMEFVLN